MKTTTVRISQSSHLRLNEIAKIQHDSMQVVLDKAIAAYYEKLFWQDTHQAYANLRSDPKEWQEEQDERQLWESTLKDGLEDE